MFDELTSMVLHQSYVTQWHLLLRLIRYFSCYVFIYSAVMFTNNRFPYCAMALYCFCLLAESYETTNQSINQSIIQSINHARVQLRILVAFIRNGISNGRSICNMSFMIKFQLRKVFLSDCMKFRIDSMGNASKVNIGDNAHITMNWNRSFITSITANRFKIKKNYFAPVLLEFRVNSILTWIRNCYLLPEII